MNTDAQALKRNLARTTLATGTGVTRAWARRQPRWAPGGRGGQEPHRGTGGRRGHALHHGGHGRRHRHRCRPRGRLDRPRDGNPHGGGGHQALRLRGQAPEGGGRRIDALKQPRRLLIIIPNSASCRCWARTSPTRTPSAPPTTCSTAAVAESPKDQLPRPRERRLRDVRTVMSENGSR